MAPPYAANLQIYLNAKSITGKVDGDPISQWDDESGNARHATQATSAKQPLYKTAIHNGHPAILFDGVDDFLACADPTLGGQASATVYVAYRAPDGVSERYFFHRTSHIDGRVETGGTNRLRFGLQTSTYTILNSTSSPTWDAFQRATFWYDGVNYTLRNEGAVIAGPAGKTGNIGAGSGNFNLGSSAGTGGFLSAYLFALLVYEEAHDATELADTEAWLAAEFAVAAKAPPPPTRGARLALLAR